MTLSQLRRSALPLFSVLFLLAIPVQAAKRRAVAHPTAGPKLTISVKGVVTDKVTGLPVINAKVTAANRSDLTNKEDDSTAAKEAGTFQVKGAVAYGTVTVTVERTGYKTFTTQYTASGDYTLNVQLEPTPTVTVKTTGGETVQLDRESVLFGYVAGAFQYQYLEAPEFCLGDGTRASYNVAQMHRIVGPATTAQSSSCCDQELLKINIELTGSAPTDLLLADKCHTGSTIDITGRDHVQGVLRYFPLTEVTEVIFP
jgi:hypothetical protein